MGGKSADGVFQRIINLIPPCRLLIEPFAGEATIARKIRPPAEIILIDKLRQPGLVVPSAARFISGEGISFIERYRYRGDEMIYADPPYLLSTRGHREYYADELPDREHERLLRVVKAINCRVLLSGYRSPLYDRELGAWNRIEFKAMTRGGTVATEVLWFNYPKPTVLHDYRFVGDTWRERANHRRQMRRWVARFAALPALERGSVFQSLADAAGLEIVQAICSRPTGSAAGARVLELGKPVSAKAATQAESGEAAGPSAESGERRRWAAPILAQLQPGGSAARRP